MPPEMEIEKKKEKLTGAVRLVKCMILWWTAVGFPYCYFAECVRK